MCCHLMRITRIAKYIPATFFLAVFDRLIDLFFMVAARHPADKERKKKNTKKKWVCGSQQPSEPNLQAALVTQRRRTCSDALRPGRGKNSLPGDATSVSGCF